MEKLFGRRFDKICINILQNTNMEKKFAWRFDDNIAARAEFGMKHKKKKKNLLKVLQAEDLFGAVEAAEP
jgi:hypothetical protein